MPAHILARGPRIISKSLVIPSATPNEQAGAVMVQDGDTLVISAPEQNDGNNAKQGRVLIYSYQDGPNPHWAAQRIITGMGPNRNLGATLALSNGVLAIGSPLNRGEVFLFGQHEGGQNNWGLITSILPPFLQNKRFGKSISLHGGRLAIGYDNSNASQSPSSVGIYEQNEGGPNAWGKTEDLTVSGITDFGASISLNNERLLIGAPKAIAQQSGLAYLYSFDGSSWSLDKTFTPPSAQTGGFFGAQVLLKKRRVFISETGNSTQGLGSGAVHLYEQNEGGSQQWGRTKTLSPPHSAPGAQFGEVLAFHGDKLIVGAPKQSVYGKAAAGVVYFYERNLNGADQWGLLQTLANGAGSSDDRWGADLIALEDNYIISRPGADDVQTDLGEIVIKPWPTSTFQESHIDDIALGAGRAIDSDQDTLVVGAPLNADQSPRAGMVLVYDLKSMPQGRWQASDLPTPIKLYAPDAQDGDYFGASVDIEGDLLVIGAPQDATYNQGQQRTTGGRVYIYQKQGTSWQYVQTLEGNPTEAQNFGHAVSLDRQRIHVSAPRSPTNGVVYRYGYNPNTQQWTRTQTITPTTPQTTSFGHALTAQGNRLLISGKTTLTGYVDVYLEDVSTPDQTSRTQTITPAMDTPSFGDAIHVANGVAAIGAPDSQNQGEVFVYEAPDSRQDFAPTATITPTVIQSSARFGGAVLIQGDDLHVGATQYHVQGATWRFKRENSTTWAAVAQHAARADNASQGHQFGQALAAVGDHLFIGAPNAIGDATTTKGQLAIISQIDPRSKTINVSPTETNTQYGDAMAVSGDLVVVGAPSIGKVYILERNEGGEDTWNTIKVIAGPSNVNYGEAVDIDGDILVVGASENDSDDGTVFIYERNSGGVDNWGQIKTLDGGGNHRFGKSVSLSGSRLAVGAPGAHNDGGHVHIFERHDDNTPDSWNLIADIHSPAQANQNQFGRSVSLQHGTIVIGEPRFQLGNSGGKAYVYEQHHTGPNNWGLLKALSHTNNVTNDRFGLNVQIQGDLIAVSAPNRDRVKLYNRATEWGLIESLTNTNFQAQSTVIASQCGDGLWLTRTHVFVGCPNHNQSITVTDIGLALDLKRHQMTANNWEVTVRREDSTNAFSYFGRAIAKTADNLLVTTPSFSVQGNERNGRLSIYTNTRQDAAPVVALTSPANATQQTNAVTLTGSVDAQSWVILTIVDSAGKTWSQRTVFSESGAWTLPDVALPTGNYFATARSQRQGQWGVAVTNAFSIQTDLFLMLNPEDNTATNTLPNLNGQTNAGQTVTVRFFNGTYDQTALTTADAQGKWTLDWSDTMLPEGVYTVEVTVDDGMGAIIVETITITYDAQPPGLVITPQDGATLSTNQPTITCTTEPDAQVTIELRDGNNDLLLKSIALADAQGNCDLTLPQMLADGQYTINASSVDDASNESVTGPISFAIDTVDPTVAIIGPSGLINTTTQTISGTGEPGVSVRIEIKQGNMVVYTETITVDAQGDWQSMPLTMLPDGTYTIDVEASDNANNTATDQITFAKDTTAPVLTITSPTGVVGAGDPVINGLVDAGESVQVTVTNGVNMVVFTQTVTGTAQSTWQTSMITPTLPDGTYTITVQTSDAAGNMAMDAMIFTVDTSFPALSITTPLNNSQLNSTTLTISGTTTPGQRVVLTLLDDQGATTQVTMVNGDAQGAWNQPVSLTNDGVYTINASATNQFNRQATATTTFTLDTMGPAVTITAPTNQLRTNKALDIDVTSDEATSVTVTITDAQGQVVAQGTATQDMSRWTWAPGVLPDGTYTVTIDAQDVVGNPTKESVTVTIDTQGPQLAITAPTDGDVLDQPRPTFEGTTDASVVDIELGIVGDLQPTATAQVNATNNTWSWTPTTDLELGDYMFTVTASDDLGNSTSQSITLTIFRTLVLTITSPVDGYMGPDNLPTWRGSVNQPALLTLFIDGIQVHTIDITTTDQFNWSWQNPSALDDGVRVLRVEATTQDAQMDTRTVDLLIDTMAPNVQITWPTDGDTINSDELIIEGVTEQGLATVALSLDGQSPVAVPVEEDGTFSYTWQNITEGDHTLEATATDAVGNMGSSGVVTFDVEYPDVTIKDNENGVSTTSTPTFRGKALPESTITIIIRDEDGQEVYRGEAIAKEDGTWVHTVEDPLPNGTYTVDIEIQEPGSTRKKKRRLILVVDNFTPDAFTPGYCSATPIRTPGAPIAPLWAMLLIAFGVIVRKRRA